MLFTHTCAHSPSRYATNTDRRLPALKAIRQQQTVSVPALFLWHYKRCGQRLQYMTECTGKWFHLLHWLRLNYFLIQVILVSPSFLCPRSTLHVGDMYGYKGFFNFVPECLTCCWVKSFLHTWYVLLWEVQACRVLQISWALKRFQTPLIMMTEKHIWQWLRVPASFASSQVFIAVLSWRTTEDHWYNDHWSFMFFIRLTRSKSSPHHSPTFACFLFFLSCCSGESSQ